MLSHMGQMPKLLPNRGPLDCRGRLNSPIRSLLLLFALGWGQARSPAPPTCTPPGSGTCTSRYYWPDRRSSGADHYEAAWDTIQQQNAGRPHPVAGGSFATSSAWLTGWPPISAGRTTRFKTILGYANAGAQVSYSGALMENVQSLGRSRPARLRAAIGTPTTSRRAPGPRAAGRPGWTWSTSPITTRSRR